MDTHSYKKHLLGILLIVAALVVALGYVSRQYDQYLIHTLDTVGTERWVYSFALVGAVLGMLLWFLVFMRHHHQQQMAVLQEREDALREAEEKYRTLVEYARDAILILQQGRIVYCNPAFRKLLGDPEAEAMARHFLEVVALEEHEWVAAYVNEQQQVEGAPAQYEMGLITQDGQRVTVEVKACVIPYQSQPAMLVMMRNITERKRVEVALAQHAQELTRSNADLELFAYAASHDLQEPLRKITSFSELLSKHVAGRLDTEAETYIGYITDAAVRMRGLIHDLLAYSHIGKNASGLQPTDVEALLEETLSTLHLTICELEAEVTYEALPKVMAHPSLLGQLLQNLIGNALKFHSEVPPQVHVSAEQRGDVWQFAVQDNGIGIEPQYAERIFVIFQRLHGRAAYPGTGIGLAICQRIVEYHSGRIWVESALGKGATFYFTLPVTPPEPLDSSLLPHLLA